MPTTHFFLNIFLVLMVLAAVALMMLCRKSGEARPAFFIGSVIIVMTIVVALVTNYEDEHDPMFLALQAAKVPTGSRVNGAICFSGAECSSRQCDDKLKVCVAQTCNPYCAHNNICIDGVRCAPVE